MERNIGYVKTHGAHGGVTKVTSKSNRVPVTLMAGLPVPMLIHIMAMAIMMVVITLTHVKDKPVQEEELAQMEDVSVNLAGKVKCVNMKKMIKINVKITHNTQVNVLPG